MKNKVLEALSKLRYEQAQAVADFWLARLPVRTEPCHEGRYEVTRVGPLEITAITDDYSDMTCVQFTIGRRTIVHRGGDTQGLPAVSISVDTAHGPKHYEVSHKDTEGVIINQRQAFEAGLTPEECLRAFSRFGWEINDHNLRCVQKLYEYFRREAEHGPRFEAIHWKGPGWYATYPIGAHGDGSPVVAALPLGARDEEAAREEAHAGYMGPPFFLEAPRGELLE